MLRLTGFTALPLLSLITPLLLLPVASSLVGGYGISSVISGQAIGTFAATVLLWGWNVDGPVAIARAANARERGEIYLSSVRTRLLLMIIVLPAAALTATVVAVPEFATEAAAMCLAVALAGLSPAWFCIGAGQPKLLAVFDTLPRFIATLLAAPLLLLTHQFWVYTMLTAAMMVLSLVVFHRKYSSGGQWLPINLRATLDELGSQAKTAGISLAGNAYASTPAPIATATTAPVASGSLASADTLYRFGLFTVVALGNTFQGWTIEHGATNQRVRHITAILAHAGLGVLGAAILTVAGPFVSGVLFAGKAQASTELCAYYGLSFAFLSASTPFIRNILIPAGLQSLVLRWTLVSAVLGVAAMVAAGMAGSATGIALGMALSEAVLFVALLIPGLKHLKQERILDHAAD
ncbi:polysaccharide biosynthesis protein [Arthrobacter sp. CJ23]|uniref:polysaccharide biosynthesis protein n=1 Tax=Arthrobacter sp. CJ23 TaxID=2972479 RepID=UPI00215B82BF|nr:polysaccharide biosynthesis protein [Arthrobacter sp. CJ23]UVJ38306.1 polysaccharide biosynthesis protein [Arthrobacter sp. CJ23]